MGYVFQIDHDHGLPIAHLRELLGGKGAGLNEMTTKLDLPVPPGFTISTPACRAFGQSGLPDELADEIMRHLDLVAQRAGRRFGATVDPLLVRVRSGAAHSMPGMLDTVLNVGLNPATVEGLARASGDPMFAYDSYRRFLLSYATVVLDVDIGRLTAALPSIGQPLRPGDDDNLARLCFAVRDVIRECAGRAVPDDPRAQLRGAAEAVFRSWDSPKAQVYRRHSGIDDTLGTAVTVQSMVFGNRDDRSGTGVVFSRDPNTGAPGAFGDFLLRAQGEDVVDGGARTDDMAAFGARFPRLAAELTTILHTLETHFRDMCDVEFTVERGRLWILQTRVGKRTAAAAVRIAVDMASEQLISRAEAVDRVTAEDLQRLVAGGKSVSEAPILARGLGASPGVATGRVHFDAQACVDAVDHGERVLLVRRDTSPEDVHGIQVAEGVLTARGGMVSHAAVVARGWGIPAVVGVATLNFDGADVRIGDTVVHEGDVLTINGTDGTVLAGRVEAVPGALPPEVATLREWAQAREEACAEGETEQWILN